MGIKVDSTWQLYCSLGAFIICSIIVLSAGFHFQMQDVLITPLRETEKSERKMREKEHERN